MPTRVLGTCVVWLAALGTVSPVAAQAPLFLVNSDTRVGSLEFVFPEGRTLRLEQVNGQTSIENPGLIAAIQNALSWLPLVSRASPVPFEPLELQKDVVRLRRFYTEMGFLNAHVDYEVQLDTLDNAVGVRMVVTEGPPLLLDTVMFSGPSGEPVTALLPDELAAGWNGLVKEVAQASVGRRLGRPERQRLRAAPMRWAQDRGFAFAAVDDELTVDSVSNRAELRVSIALGPRARVDSIQFDGNQALSVNTLRRELPFRVGDWYSASRLSEGQRQIFGLELVRLALGDIPAGQPTDSTVTVRYRLNEGRPRLITGETGYSSSSGVRARGDWAHRDFLGSARTLTASLEARSAWLALEGSADQRFGASLSLRQPYLGDRRISGTLAPFIEYRDGIIDRSWSVGVGAAVLWERGPLTTATVDYRLSRREVLEIRAGLDGTTASDFIDVLAALDSLESGTASSVFGLSTVNGRVDDPLDPSRGWILRTSAQVAGPAVLSAVEYVRGQADGVRFFDFGGGKGLTLRAGAGLLHPFGVSAPTPQSDTIAQLVRLRDAMLTAGGTQSVRGWGNGLLGPKLPNYRTVPSGDSVLLEADRYVPFAGLARISTSAELRLPMPFSESDNGTFVFLDGAKVWNPDERFGGGGPDPLGQERYFWATGAGVRLLTLAGSVRLSVGYKLNPSPLDLRDAGLVAAALSSGHDLSTVPIDNFRRWHLHLAIGRGL